MSTKLLSRNHTFGPKRSQDEQLKASSARTTVLSHPTEGHTLTARASLLKGLEHWSVARSAFASLMKMHPIACKPCRALQMRNPSLQPSISRVDQPTARLQTSGAVVARSIDKHGTGGQHPCQVPTHERQATKLLSSQAVEQPQQDSSTHSTKQPTRRELFLNSFGVLLLVGTDDPTTIVNAILSGYGLPTFRGDNALKTYDEFENDWVFAYPRSWVARPNTQRSGFYVSNFQTADKATVETFPVPPGSGPDVDKEIVRLAVNKAVVPGQDQADDKLTPPPESSIKSEEKTIDGQRYIYLTFPSETLTRSGYAIKRRHWAVVATRKGTAYTLSASARSDQYNKEKEVLLQQIVETFRLR